MTTTSSAAPSASPIAGPKILVRETRWGWKATTTRPVPGQRACGLQVAGDLVGVVGVAVVDADPGRLALELHAPARPGEGLQAAREVGEGEAEPQPGAQRSQRVEHVVAARDPQRDLAQPPRPGHDGEGRASSRGRSAPPARRSASADSPTVITSRPRSAAGRASSAAPGSSAQATRKPPGRMRSRNSHEGRPVGLLRAVVVEVVGLHVGHDRRGRRVDEEGAVALVGLGDEEVAAAVVGVGARLVELAADRERRVGAAVLQRHGEQRGGRGLAVGAGDRDHRRPAHHRVERGRAGQQPQPPAPRLHDLGVVGAHRGGDDDGVGVGDLLGAVTDVTCAPSARSACEGAGLLASLPLTAMPRASMMRAMPDRPAPPMPTKCTRPSASAARHLVGDGDPHRRPPRGAQAPCGPAARRRRAGSARPRPATSSPAASGRVARSGRVAEAHSGVKAASSTSSPPPASTTGRALSACSPLPIGSGTKTAGSPTAATSVTVFAPARQTRQVGGGVGEVHPVDVAAPRRTAGRPVAGVHRRPRRAGPTTCSTCTPAAASAGWALPDRLVQPARALGPTGDQQRGRGRGRARSARARLGRAAPPGRGWRSSGGSAGRGRRRGAAAVSGKLVAT